MTSARLGDGLRRTNGKAAEGQRVVALQLGDQTMRVGQHGGGGGAQEPTPSLLGLGEPLTFAVRDKRAERSVQLTLQLEGVAAAEGEAAEAPRFVGANTIDLRDVRGAGSGAFERWLDVFDYKTMGRMSQVGAHTHTTHAAKHSLMAHGIRSLPIR